MADSLDHQPDGDGPATHDADFPVNQITGKAASAVHETQTMILRVIMQVPSHLRLPLAFLAIGSFTSLGFGVLWAVMVRLTGANSIIAIPLVLSLLAGATLALFYREAAPQGLVEFLMRHYIVKRNPSIAERLGISKPLTYEEQGRKLVKALDDVRKQLWELAQLHIAHADEIAGEFKMSPDEYTARWEAVANLLAK